MTGNIISNGTTAFMPLIDKLGNITGEFTPYIIYIGIGILGIALTFRVVQSILGYLKGESMNTFKREDWKERRTRRRRNRRFTRSVERYRRYRRYRRY